jgi:hypothetical protein
MIFTNAGGSIVSVVMSWIQGAMAVISGNARDPVPRDGHRGC